MVGHFNTVVCDVANRMVPLKFSSPTCGVRLILFRSDSIVNWLLSIHSLFETTQTLFWAVFGLVDLDSFDLDGIKIFTRFWGMLMFGTYSVINIVVLLNLLIAMMNHSYQLISVREYLGFTFRYSGGAWWCARLVAI